MTDDQRYTVNEIERRLFLPGLSARFDALDAMLVDGLYACEVEGGTKIAIERGPWIQAIIDAVLAHLWETRDQPTPESINHALADRNAADRALFGSVETLLADIPE